MEKVKKEACGGEVMRFEQPPADYRSPFPLRSVTACREPVNLVNSVPKLYEPVGLVRPQGGKERVMRLFKMATACSQIAGSEFRSA